MERSLSANCLTSINELELSELPLHLGNPDNGSIVVVEANIDVPFAIQRIFTIRFRKGAIRGGHAHRYCTQFMICPHGIVEINCDDGRAQKSFVLDRGNLGLLVRPGIWTTQRFQDGNSFLLVVCDQPYQESDYVRNYANFLAWKNTNDASAITGCGEA
jgi:dTDP-4-dehydrorhamnose 3,5-epimerase-like enzyme